MQAPLNDALEDLRISGSVLLHERYCAPWAIDIPDEATLRSALGAARDVRIVPFHFVRSGGFDLSYDEAAPRRIATHQVAICPSGAPHRMSFGRRSRAVPLADVLQRKPSFAFDGRSDDATELICGAFQLRASPLNPLLGSLPKILTVDTAGEGVDPMLIHAAAMLDLEVAKGPTSFVAARMLEVFFAEALRAYGRAQGRNCSGWFRGVDDPRIGAALTKLHEKPGAPWTVAALAETVSMSPSRFAARFREVMGQTAMSYVSSWRMTVACRKLRETSDNLDRIANAIGYQDVASFSRAFKGQVGQSPSHYRVSQAA
jgi:AraC-like DNA-binding protein